MSKQGEKRLTAKTNISMKKYEIIYGTFMVFAVFTSIWFWDRFGIFFLNSQKRSIFKKCILKIIFII